MGSISFPTDSHAMLIIHTCLFISWLVLGSDLPQLPTIHLHVHLAKDADEGDATEALQAYSEDDYRKLKGDFGGDYNEKDNRKLKVNFGEDYKEKEKALTDNRKLKVDFGGDYNEKDIGMMEAKDDVPVSRTLASLETDSEESAETTAEQANSSRQSYEEAEDVLVVHDQAGICDGMDCLSPWNKALTTLCCSNRSK